MEQCPQTTWGCWWNGESDPAGLGRGGVGGEAPLLTDLQPMQILLSWGPHLEWPGACQRKGCERIEAGGDILGRKLGGKQRQLESQGHLAPRPPPLSWGCISVPLTAELSAWHMVGIWQACVELRGGRAGPQAQFYWRPPRHRQGADHWSADRHPALQNPEAATQDE